MRLVLIACLSFTSAFLQSQQLYSWYEDETIVHEWIGEKGTSQFENARLDSIVTRSKTGQLTTLSKVELQYKDGKIDSLISTGADGWGFVPCEIKFFYDNEVLDSMKYYNLPQGFHYEANFKYEDGKIYHHKFKGGGNTYWNNGNITFSYDEDQNLEYKGESFYWESFSSSGSSSRLNRMTYNEKKQLESDSLFINGELSSTIQYGYLNNDLVSIRRYSQDNELRYEETHDYSNAPDSISIITNYHNNGRIEESKFNTDNFGNINCIWNDSREVCYYYTYLSSTSNIIEYSNEGWGIFPNPTSGIVNIQSKFLLGSLFEVYNFTGKKVFEKELSSNKERVDLGLNSGLYFYVLRSIKENVSGRLVISN